MHELLRIGRILSAWRGQELKFAWDSVAEVVAVRSKDPRTPMVISSVGESVGRFVGKCVGVGVGRDVGLAVGRGVGGGDGVEVGGGVGDGVNKQAVAPGNA